MKELIRCKPCGYIDEENKIGEFCPACGASIKYFEPYKDKMKPNRRKILNLDMHPIAVHFPQTISVLILFSLLFNFVLPKIMTQEILAFIYILAVLLPFSVIGAFISGLIDGKVRFKKFKGRKLKHKIIMGSIMIISSTVVAFAAVMIDKHSLSKTIVLSGNLVSLILAILLAQIGKKLMYAEMPG